MMLVHPDRRRLGIGTRLMELVIQSLEGAGIACIKLDATPAGRPVYEKLGFVEECLLTRWQRPANTPISWPEVGTTRTVVAEDWDSIERLDRRATGVDRSRFVRSVAEASRAVMACLRDGRVEGWGMIRAGAVADYLGPVVCENSDVAMSLCSALIRLAGERSIAWDLFDESAVARAMAERFGFAPLRPLTRMRRGPATVKSEPSLQFGLVDPSIG
jgi:hypothetical protein